VAVLVPDNQPGWLKQLVAWSREPCSADVWIYRGQSAQFPTILPGFLRPAHRDLYGNRLHSLDVSLVRELMQRTSRLTARQLFGDETPVLAQPLGPSALAIVGGAGGPTDFAPTQAEVTAALAQHYGLPTLYVDVTFDVIVAAFFATHEWADGDFRPTRGRGRIFRWPARRKSPLVLEINDPGRPDPAVAFIDSMYTGTLRDALREGLASARRDTKSRNLPGMRVLDLTSLSATIRRPHTQRAALACPIYFDGNPLAAEWLPLSASSRIPTALDDLCFSDMGRLPSAEKFDVPTGAGAELPTATGARPEALFPDRVDLGHSFFGVAALLSSISYGSPDDEASFPALSSKEFEMHDLLRKRLERGLKAATALIERESFRLIPGFPVDSLRASPSLSDAGHELRVQAAVAVEAAARMGSAEAIKRTKRQVRLVAQELRRARRAVAAKTARELGAKLGIELTLDPDAFCSPAPRMRKVTERDRAEVAQETRRRLEAVERIVSDARQLPAYALVGSSPLPFDRSVFPTDPEYESAVRSQATALAHWLGADPFAISDNCDHRRCS
jgi:FRG domain-containing protein